VTFDDNQLIAAVREGDERAFVTLVERYHPSLQRLAHLYIDASTVEDVVQDTWIGVLHGLPNFEGRASFKTWLFRILVNRARTRAVRNARTIPMSSLVHEQTETQEYAVDPGRFRPADDQYPGHWLHLERFSDAGDNSTRVSESAVAGDANPDARGPLIIIHGCPLA
jgi:RNA polymerase sigma-70 factor, ECF subfamily